MLGEPKYTCGQRVLVGIHDENNNPIQLEGEVWIIDPWGTDRYPEEVCYDLRCIRDGRLINLKHVPENCVTEINNTNEENSSPSPESPDA